MSNAGAGGMNGGGGAGGMDGDGGEGGMEEESACMEDIEVMENAGITSGHPHAFTVPMADIEAGVTKTYEMGMSGGHTHSVRISAADFAQLAMGMTVMIPESAAEPGADESACYNLDGEGNGHTHAMMLSCA
jgi:hypothetical protein